MKSLIVVISLVSFLSLTSAFRYDGNLKPFSPFHPTPHRPWHHGGIRKRSVVQPYIANHFFGGSHKVHPDNIDQIFGEGSNNYFKGGNHELDNRNPQQVAGQFLRPVVENFPGGWNPANGNPANPTNFRDAITRRFQGARANPNNNAEFLDHQGGNVRGQNHQGGFFSHNHGKRSVEVDPAESLSMSPEEFFKMAAQYPDKNNYNNGGTHHHGKRSADEQLFTVTADNFRKAMQSAYDHQVDPSDPHFQDNYFNGGSHYHNNGQ